MGVTRKQNKKKQQKTNKQKPPQPIEQVITEIQFVLMFERIHALPFEKILKHFVNKKAPKEVFHESYYLCQNVKTKLSVNYISKGKTFDIKIIYLGTLTSLSGGLSSAIGNA